MKALIVDPQRFKSPPTPLCERGAGGIFTVNLAIANLMSIVVEVLRNVNKTKSIFNYNQEIEKCITLVIMDRYDNLYESTCLMPAQAGIQAMFSIQSRAGMRSA